MELVPVMSALATVVSTNVLTADAVASALVLDAPIVVSTRSELLERAATLAGVPTRHAARGDSRHGCAPAHSRGHELGRVAGTSPPKAQRTRAGRNGRRPGREQRG